MAYLFFTENKIHWSSAVRVISTKKELCHYGKNKEERWVASQEREP